MKNTIKHTKVLYHTQRNYQANYSYESKKSMFKLYVKDLLEEEDS